MKKLLLFSLFISISFFLHSQNSYIQVVADPGISIYLDGEKKGVTTSELGGMLIYNLESGSHLIRAEKSGFHPQEDRISLTQGEVYPYHINNLIPEIEISESGRAMDNDFNRKTGTLKIQSLPIEIRIKINALDIDYNKTKDIWLAEDVPSGEYVALYTWGNKTITQKVNIQPENTTHLLVDMVNGQVSEREIIPELNADVPENTGDNYYSYSAYPTASNTAQPTSGNSVFSGGRNSSTYTSSKTKANKAQMGYRVFGYKVDGELVEPMLENCNTSGRNIDLTIDIKISRQGFVTSAEVNSPKDYNKCVIDACVEAAKASRFTNVNDEFYLEGWIRYRIPQ